ncbi:MAG: trigger factor [Clostridia bacterium]|nr:trigger factor [Clostridia bacterium]
MSLKSQETTGTNEKKITFDIDRKTFDDAVNAAYKKQAPKINVPGFRKGKAPRMLIEKMYGKEVFYDDALNEVIPAAYEDAVKELDDVIVSRPAFEVESIDENGVVVTASFYVKPDINVKKYVGLEAEKPIMPVTDEDVESELKRVQERNSRMIEISDRPVQSGDIATIDYKGFCDGVAFDGGEGTDYALSIGSNTFIPGFEDQIIGHDIGDEFDVNVTFPADYHAENLAGKEAVFKCKVKEIKFKELPEIDDEFAKDVSDFDNLEDYKADIRKELAEHNEEHAKTHLDENLLNLLVENVEGEIPEIMFDNEAENMVRDYESRLRMNGLDLETYFKYTGQNLEDMKKQMRPGAEKQVKSRLALEKIAKLEGFEASEDEIEEEYKKLAENYSVDIDKMKQYIDPKDLAEDIKVRKAVDFVRDKAVIKEVEHTHHHDEHDD